jgi:hypothetical protein
MRASVRNRFVARLWYWQMVVAFGVSLTLQVRDDPWTNWNFLYLASEILLFASLYRILIRLEGPATRWFLERFEKKT